ncbi:MAG: cation:proton antiporter [Nitrosopumilus sp.]|jgi:NhaP-type Na+/H+ or K+/H+ antiporter|nr:cation:proton antiporter [Nitrosopumilus sp.]
MYEELAVLALFVFFYSVVARRIEVTVVSGPMVFVLAGFVMGPLVLGWFESEVTSTGLRVVADLTLALVLFIDAAHADLSTLRKHFQIPARMLVIGLPGVIALGFVFAALLFPELTLFEAAILGTMLAATDAALGKAVITNKDVPVRVREGLNVESGLNDGLCVPILFVFIALAEGTATDATAAALTLVAEELGIGLLVGLAMAGAGGPLLRACWNRGWLTEVWVHIAVAALALGAFAIAQSLHGSGYIAAFAGGLLFGSIAGKDRSDVLLVAEADGETLALLTWLGFGAAVIGQYFELFTWQVFAYAALSLTVVRVVPVVLSLTGSGEPAATRLFLGWFGPRGLASVVFAIIVLNTDLPGAPFVAVVVACTVFASLVAHGMSANPLAKRLASIEGGTGQKPK